MKTTILGRTEIAMLDQLYNEGTMVVMTVDNGISDMEKVSEVITYYKDHPAILMWMLGSEWNLNLHFGASSSVLEAAQRTELAASLVKTLDPNHPVASSYGEIDIDEDGLRLSDTDNYVNTVCPKEGVK